jgi:hypothetical protein
MRPPSLILLMIHPRIDEYFPAKAEKWEIRIIIIILLLLIQFNRYLLTCRLNSTSPYYKASTKTQIEHKNSTNTENKH